MAKYVPEGSFLYCDKGVIPTPFRITEYAEVSLTDVPIASDENVKGIINVLPFGICAVKGGQPCLPATNNQMWINMSENVCIGPGEALLDKSQLPCTQGGTIKIAPSFLHALTDMYDDPSEMFDKMVDMLKGTGENVLAAAKGVGKGFWGLVTFAWDVVKFPFVEGWTAITDFDEFKDNWGSRYNSAKDFGQAAWEKGEQLYGLATDPDARAAMWAYMSDPDVWEQAFDGVYSAVAEMDNTEIAEFGGQMAFEVLLGVFTGGMGASRHIAKTDDVFRAAQALENLDDFGDVGRALENLDDIDDIIPEELLDDINDVPGGQTILGQADEIQGGIIDDVLNGDIDLSTSNRKGNFGEMVADKDMVDNGFDPLHQRLTDIDGGHNGIDGVFGNPNPPPDYIIVESKYGSAGIQPANPDTGLPRQMSDDWIDGRLEDVVGEDLADEMITNRNYERVQAKVDESGNVKYSRIGDDGYVIRGNAGKFDPQNP